MENILLDAVKETHVHGRWQVKNVLRSNKTDNPFLNIKDITFSVDSFTALGETVFSGNYQLLKEDEIIYNPQLRFYQNGVQIANAIITRLYFKLDNGRKVGNLILYFNTGLELVLYKEI